jgi:flagellar FliJ protein
VSANATRTRVQSPAAAGLRADHGKVSGSSFRFRLERVRALREHGEDLAKQELAGALVRREECEDELQAAEQSLDRARDAQRDAGSAGTSATDLIARQAYLERVERARDATVLDLAGHEADVATRRDLLAEAARARQALERLKERRRTDHDLETARQEGRELDEVALNVFRRGAA